MSSATKATHTPGPWHRNIRAGGKYPTVFAGRNTHIAQVSQQADPAETEANIDLIAAAPDLLAALQNFVDVCDHGQPVKFIECIESACIMARAAIAKATGETP